MATRITIDVDTSHVGKYTLESLVEMLEEHGVPVTRLKSVYKPDKDADIFKGGRWTSV